MPERKEKRKFVFSVEGETEKWYLEWLQKRVNESKDALYFADITAEVEKSPMKYIKKTNAKSTPSVTHVCDVEGQTANDQTAFENVLKELKKANKQKNIAYSIGYSNLSFELWLILHKQNCSGGCNTKKEYLKHINFSFSENFDSLDEYKKEENFQKCLEKLSLQDVKDAVGRADRIMENNLENGRNRRESGRYAYYTENPALTIHHAIREILTQCGIMLFPSRTR